MTTTSSHSVDEVLRRIAPYPLTLPFMSMEGHSRYVEIKRTDSLCFDRDTRFNAYISLPTFHEKFHKLGLMDYNRVDFTFSQFFGPFR